MELNQNLQIASNLNFDKSNNSIAFVKSKIKVSIKNLVCKSNLLLNKLTPHQWMSDMASFTITLEEFSPNKK